MLQTSQASSWLLGSNSLQQMIILVLVMLGIGFSEETMFLGILFYGFSNRFSILASALLSAVIFGVFHYENLILGASMAETNPQVMHAVAAGFMYIALRSVENRGHLAGYARPRVLGFLSL